MEDAYYIFNPNSKSFVLVDEYNYCLFLAKFPTKYKSSTIIHFYDVDVILNSVRGVTCAIHFDTNV